MAPIHLIRLLEIYCSYAEESCPHLMRPTGRLRPLQDLEEWGLIERCEPVSRGMGWSGTDHNWSITDKGRVFVQGLCDLQLPIQVWSMGNG